MHFIKQITFLFRFLCNIKTYIIYSNYLLYILSNNITFYLHYDKYYIGSCTSNNIDCIISNDNFYMSNYNNIEIFKIDHNGNIIIKTNCIRILQNKWKNYFNNKYTYYLSSRFIFDLKNREIGII
jgi:hypothetical protein